MGRKIILAGGSGFIGQSIAPLFLSAGYEIIVLSRSARVASAGMSYRQWDGKTPGDWADSLEGASALVNFTGRSINCRHTPQNRRVILESRVDSVRVLGQALTQCSQPPEVFVQISAIGIYGDTADRVCDEGAPHGRDFVAHVCEQWEEAFGAVAAPSTRKVVLRLGVVLGRGGGILQVLGKLTRLFLGGRAGNGRQFMSWVHIEDVGRAILLALQDPAMTGTFNTTAPEPRRNAEFMGELRRVLHRPWSPPVPEFAVRLGSWLMGTEASLALEGQRAVPTNLLKQDFQFQFPGLRLALEDLLRK